MNLMQEAEGLVREELDAYGVDHSKAQDLEAVLHLVLHMKLKTITISPRLVHRSSEFNEKLKHMDAEKQSAADAIFEKVAAGEDISGHLGRSNHKPEKLDRLLADWGIQHLHISNRKNKPTDKLFASTGPVMFVLFHLKDAYFIDIYSHDTQKHPEVWTRQELIAILRNNWPQVLEPFRMKGVVGLSRDVSDPMERKKLRNANVNAPIQIEKDVYSNPGGGLMADGTPMRVLRAADRIIDSLEQLDRDIMAFNPDTRRRLAQAAGITESSLDYELVKASGQVWSLRVKGSAVVVVNINEPIFI
ncbi:hypothetical protein GCM10023213_31120 [Prosthecobacter algae]|uniref:Uncharacterized protein n=1 Tax=Prosthecobacter algae TaxID=1144682 RepID=A0ABP9PGW4_9BACT